MNAEKSEATTQKGPKLTIKDVAGRLDAVVGNVDTAMADLRSDMAESAATNTAILELLQKQSRAIDQPVSLKKRLEADEQDLGQVADIGDSQIITGNFDINSAEFSNKAAIEKFMHETVRVHIHESNNDMEVDCFCISVNNNKVHFRFGDTKDVKRYIVEGLARARPETYNNKQVVQHTTQGSEMVIINQGTRQLRYPFSVEVDHNPVGRSWLRCVLAQS